MKLILNEEELYLKETAKNFAENTTPVNHFRSLRDNKDPQLWSNDVWKEMVELGWSGILIPEEYGGSDFGLTGICAILQECGKTLAPSPLFATGVLGAYALTHFGSDSQKSKYLPKIASGDITTAVAIDETNHHNPSYIETNAKQDGENFILNGKKTLVVDGASADLIIVLARTSGNPGENTGLTMFLVEKDDLDIKMLSMADSRNYANIYLNNVSVSKENILGDIEAGGDSIDSLLDIGRIAMAAEMLGSTEAAFETTLNYLKERKQFGVEIGSFQALQHRAAQMFCEIELTKSAVMGAMKGADENSNDLQRLASLSKSIAGDTFHLVSNESVQMHGGIGVTDEYDIGFYLKRARVCEQIFGSSNFHKERYANLSGF
jgi:alkylation response protein AidB-like acyl-CoA dehydrogenase